MRLTEHPSPAGGDATEEGSGAGPWVVSPTVRTMLVAIGVVVSASALGCELATTPPAVAAPVVRAPAPSPASGPGVESGRPVPTRSTTPSGGAERGAYEWDSATWWPDPSAYVGTLTRLKNLGVTTLYVDITGAVTLARDHSSVLAAFESDVGQLVGDAGAAGIRVDAVGGDPRWATTDRTGPSELLAVVSQIVATSPGSALDGVQFDVEPWGLGGWRSHRGIYARDWLGFVQSTVSAWRTDGLPGRLGFTVPYWFDGVTGGVPRVTFAGSSGYPFQLALALLSPLDETALNVMAYRNATAGTNGSVALFSGDMGAALTAGSRTELLAGQETGDVRPPETTFYGMTCADFEAATTAIADAFDGDTPYQGIAVDDVESLEALCPL